MGLVDQRDRVVPADLAVLVGRQYLLALDNQATLEVLVDQEVLEDLEELVGLVDQMDQVLQVDLEILEVCLHLVINTIECYYKLGIR